MKKIILSFSLLVSMMLSAQPVITVVVDGTCTGGTPKVVEIYANGTVDFTGYMLQVQTNSSTSWSGGVDLSSFGSVTNDYVYVYNDGSYDNFYTEFPAAQGKPAIESGSLSFNGDDRVRIIDASMNVIDIFGTDGVDADDDYSNNGIDWRYADSWAKRNTGMGPNPVFDVNEWNFGGRDALDNHCSASDNTPLQDDMGGIQSYTLPVHWLTIENLNVYPNPVVEGRFKVITAQDEQLHVQIFDLLGKKIQDVNVASGEWIEVSTLNKGFYILKITDSQSKTGTIKLSIK